MARRETAKRISAKDLTGVVAAICRAAGSKPKEARMVADNLVAANLAGHDSHGVGMLPIYIAAVHEGKLKPNRHVGIVAKPGPILVLDGRRGYGQVIGVEAMALGIAQAKKYGVAIVALRNSHHIGRIGAWAEQCLDAGLASIHFVNVIGRPPLVAPHGGRDARLSTNPFCAALPSARGRPIVLDMATSKIALGKARVAKNKGVAAPADSIIDARGRPTVDPGVMFARAQGALLPFGEHKGYGLAAICELFAGVLAGGGTMPSVSQASIAIINNMFSVIIDPKALGVARDLRREVTRVTKWLTASRRRPGMGPVLVPGDPERLSRAKRLREGIVIDPRTWGEIVIAGASVGLAVEGARISRR
ncbi:MAG: malate/lactate/ureidoglycolate dehydrogenase [Rhodospirillales bacterium]|nr:malate/lactate/ureidoglycolate dehydrogenase [Rhodospirillales bacterium]